MDRKDEPYCFRLHRDRVYYVSEAILNQANCISRENLLSLGTCFGKFTKSKAFRLHVTCIDYLAQFAPNKVWVKPGSEMSYLYGNHLVKGQINKMTEGVGKHEGVVVLGGKSGDIVMGMAVTAKNAAEIGALNGTVIAAFHQTDIGEYLRDEDSLI